MSSITSLILSFSSLEDESLIDHALMKYAGDVWIASVTALIEDEKLPKWWYAGPKTMGTNIYLGTYNHLDTKDFISYLKEISWKRPESVQLFTMSEFEIKFALHDIFTE